MIAVMQGCASNLMLSTVLMSQLPLPDTAQLQQGTMLADFLELDCEVLRWMLPAKGEACQRPRALRLQPACSARAGAEGSRCHLSCQTEHPACCGLAHVYTLLSLSTTSLTAGMPLCSASSIGPKHRLCPRWTATLIVSVRLLPMQVVTRALVLRATVAHASANTAQSATCARGAYGNWQTGISGKGAGRAHGWEAYPRTLTRRLLSCGAAAASRFTSE